MERIKLNKLKYCKHVQTSRIMKIIQFILLHKQKDDQVIHRKSILIGGNCIGMSFISAVFLSFTTINLFDSLFYFLFLHWFLPWNNLSRLWIILCFFLLYFCNFCKIRKMRWNFYAEKYDQFILFTFPIN